MKNFALIGAGGYIAPRHMKAVRDTGNRLVAAMDPADSVGILDSYSHDVAFFTEFERFDSYVSNLARLSSDKKIDFVSICSPNYLHDAHIRFALRIGADAICEKPLVLNPWELDTLVEAEQESGRRIYNILQLRTHHAILGLKEKIEKAKRKEKYNIDLTYITSRGRWYFESWKGDLQKSGGIAPNIGVHFFDMLIWIFGDVKHQEVHHRSEGKSMAGFLELDNANVRWFLSVDKKDLPAEAQANNMVTYRSMTVDGEEFEFSDGFTELHTLVYREILEGKGFGLEDARPAINLVHELINSKPTNVSSAHSHPFVTEY